MELHFAQANTGLCQGTGWTGRTQAEFKRPLPRWLGPGAGSTLPTCTRSAEGAGVLSYMDDDR